MNKILLVGNPNVGKSVVFSRLTGVRTTVSNYSGTTVSYTRGFLKIGKEKVEVIDVPGIYTLEPTSEAEEIALKMLQIGDTVINVVNATHLERSLYLTLHLLEKGIPLVVALNMWDETKHQGIHIEVEKLSALLGVPVIPTAAITGEGIKDLVQSIPKATSPNTSPRMRDERWAAIGNIISQVQHIDYRHHTWLDRLQDASVKPIAGVVIARQPAMYYECRCNGNEQGAQKIEYIFHNQLVIAPFPYPLPYRRPLPTHYGPPVAVLSPTALCRFRFSAC